MSKLPDPEVIFLSIAEFLDESDSYNEEKAIQLLKEYGRQVKDITLEWAADNASVFNFEVDRDSILSGKTSKDLEI